MRVMAMSMGGAVPPRPPRRLLTVAAAAAGGAIGGAVVSVGCTQLDSSAYSMPPSPTAAPTQAAAAPLATPRADKVQQLLLAVFSDRVTDARAVLETHPEAAAGLNYAGETPVFMAADWGSMQVLKVMVAAAPQAAAIPCGKHMSTPAYAGKEHRE